MSFRTVKIVPDTETTQIHRKPSTFTEEPSSSEAVEVLYKFMSLGISFMLTPSTLLRTSLIETLRIKSEPKVNVVVGSDTRSSFLVAPFRLLRPII